MSEILME